MLNTANRHRCPNCGKHTKALYLRRLQRCDQCKTVFYYNSHELYPFPRLVSGSFDAEENIAYEAEAFEEYSKESKRHNAAMDSLEPSLESSSITNRILIVALLVQIFCGLFLAPQVYLHDFSNLAVLLLLGLFMSTLVLIIVQIRMWDRLQQRRRVVNRQLNSALAKLLQIQLELDLRQTGTSKYIEVQ